MITAAEVAQRLRDNSPLEGQHVLLERAAGRYVHQGRVIHAVWAGKHWRRASTGKPIKAHPLDLWMLWPATLRG